MNWDEFIKIWEESALKPVTLSYRLYYDDAGKPIVYTMDDLPGNYIEVTPAEFAASSYDVRIVGGKLKHIDRRRAISKLVPSTAGTMCHAQDICVVVNTEPAQHWSLKTYE